MPKRVILGKKGTDYGLWVSAPGKEADSLVYDDLLIDTNRINTQPIIKGQIINPVISYNAGLSVGISLSPVVLCDPPAFTNCQLVQLFQAPGKAVYTMEINHNLGYIPLCHISIGSSSARDTYPQIYLTTTKLILMYEESKNGATLVNVFGQWQTVIEDSRPATKTFNCTINYTLFRQRAVP